MPVPSALALTNIADGAFVVAADHRNNYTAIQSAVNAIIGFLNGGVVGSALRFDGTNWAPTSNIILDNTNAKITLAAGPGPVLDTAQVAANAVLRNKLLAADANPAIQILGSGQINWGAGGASATDTNLYRLAGNTLKTDGVITAAIGFASGSGGILTRVKAGAPVDGDFSGIFISDGILVVDTLNNKIWARAGGVWKGVVIA